MQSIKETAVNVAASAKSGMDKTKAFVQEKVEKIAAGNSTEKQIATERKEEKIHNAELGKQQMKQAAHAGGAYSHSTNGTTGQPTGSHQMSALPGHGTGAPAGQVVEGTVESHPIGAATDTGTGRPDTAHNTHVGGGTNTGYGTGQPIGNHQMSAFPGHSTGAPDGQGVEETVESHPIGAATGTGTGRPNTAHDTHVGSGTNTGYGTGGAWSG